MKYTWIYVLFQSFLLTELTGKIIWSYCKNFRISNEQKIVSYIYNNNKAFISFNAKISQNVNKAVYFFARFFLVRDSFFFFPVWSGLFYEC